MRKASDRLSTALAEVQIWADRELPRMDEREAAGARAVLAVVRDVLQWEIQGALDEEHQQRKKGVEL